MERFNGRTYIGAYTVVYTRLDPKVGYRVIKPISVVKFRKIVLRNANKIDVIIPLVDRIRCIRKSYLNVQQEGE